MTDDKFGLEWGGALVSFTYKGKTVYGISRGTMRTGRAINVTVVIDGKLRRGHIIKECLTVVHDKKIEAEVMKVIEANEREQEETIGQFRVGMKVAFDKRNGEVVTGVVSRVSQKTVIVTASDGNWKVTPNLLRGVA